MQTEMVKSKVIGVQASASGALVHIARDPLYHTDAAVWPVQTIELPHEMAVVIVNLVLSNVTSLGLHSLALTGQQIQDAHDRTVGKN